MYLTQALHRAVQQHPDRIASIFGTRQRSFAEFADRVARLAGALQRLGMKPGDRVAMLAMNSDRYLEYQWPCRGRAACSIPATCAGRLLKLPIHSTTRVHRS